MKPFVILGASKTGTSTAVAVANADPSVFCLFECDFTHAADYARNAEASALISDAALFQGDTPFSASLKSAAEHLAARGWAFAHVGTKVQGIRPDIIPHLGDLPVLFMVRDVRRWAVKNRILRDVMAARTATNIVPFLIAYARYYLDSFLIPRCRRLPLEQALSSDTTTFPRALADVTGRPTAGFEQWWAKAADWKQQAPKNYSTWIEGHASAFLPPLLTDTSSELTVHPFWDEFLPVFDTYFRAPEKTFTQAEIARDQKLLDAIGARHTMRLEEGFTRFESFKIMGVSKRDDGKLKIDATDRVTQSDIEQAAERWRLS